MSKLPRIFIASSSEGHDIASACNACMDRHAEGTVWSNIYEPGGSTLDSLTTKANSVDFALFIFKPDDLTRMRGEDKLTVRDNVLFELGLFIGAIGQERCFILKPRDGVLHIPTDLLNLNTEGYNAEREDGEIISAVNAACFKFIQKMEKLGPYTNKMKDAIASERPEYKMYAPTDDGLCLLSILLSTATDDDTYSRYGLEKEYHKLTGSVSSGHTQLSLNMNLIKLIKTGLVEKTIETNYHGDGEDYIAYRLTSDGVEYVMENEDRLFKAIKSFDIPF